MSQTVAIRLFLASAFLLAGNLHAQETPVYPVRGTVINSVTHQPIARALVVLPSGQLHTMLTDSDGRFEFEGVPSGRQMIEARRPGFSAVGSRLEATQFINVGPNARDALLMLMPNSSISAQINLSTGDTASGIAVQLLKKNAQEGHINWQPAGMKQTNSEGIARFGDLRPGEYRLTVFSPTDPGGGSPADALREGYATVHYPAQEEDDTGGSVIDLRTGQQISADINLPREPLYFVSVHVTNPSFEGGGIQVKDSQGHILQYAIGYNTMQHAIEGYLPSGSYNICAISYMQERGYGCTAISMRGAPVRGAMLTILPLSPIPVIVRREYTQQTTGQPSITTWNGSRIVTTDVSINLVSISGDAGMFGGLERSRGSAGDGNLVLNGVAPGRYWVNAYAPAGYVASITSGGVDLAREPLVVSAGSSPAPIEVVLRNDMATLNARLKQDSGTENINQEAYLYLIPKFDLASQLPEDHGLSTTDQQVANLPPGTYQALAFDHPVNLAYRDPAALAPYVGKGQTVTLEAGGTAHLELDVISGEGNQ